MPGGNGGQKSSIKKKKGGVGGSQGARQYRKAQKYYRENMREIWLL